VNNNYFLDYEITKPLKEEEILKYFKLYQNGDMNAREILINHNMRLVISQIKKRFNYLYYEKEDLMSIGMLGLIKSIDSYDLNKGVKFSTYGVACINYEILTYLRKTKKYKKVYSLDMNYYEEELEMFTLESILKDYNSDVEVNYEDKESCLEIVRCIELLKEKEREIIKLYFGFESDKKYTQVELAKMFNVSQACISRTITRSLDKIKKDLSIVNIYDEINNKKKIKVKM